MCTIRMRKAGKAPRYVYKIVSVRDDGRLSSPFNPFLWGPGLSDSGSTRAGKRTGFHCCVTLQQARKALMELRNKPLNRGIKYNIIRLRPKGHKARGVHYNVGLKSLDGKQAFVCTKAHWDGWKLFADEVGR